MPYNGQGVFTPKHTWANEAAAGTPMLPANFDDQAADMAAGLSNVITRDGQGGPTADIPWHNYGITGLRDPVQPQEAATKNYVDTVDASTRTWVGATTTALPAQANNAGKVLTTDGTSATWQLAFPAQASKASYFLTNDGTNNSWSNALKATVVRFADGADATKLAAFDLSGLTTGTTRTYTLPDASGTVALRTDAAMQLLAQATVTTAVANIDFLNIFSSAYDNYVIEVLAATPSAADQLKLLLAKAGAADASNVYNVASVGNASATLLTAALASAGSSTKVTSTVVVRDANNAVDAKVIEAMGMCLASSYTSANYETAYASANAVTGFRLFWGAGATFTKATVRIYGIKNS